MKRSLAASTSQFFLWALWPLFITELIFAVFFVCSRIEQQTRKHSNWSGHFAKASAKYYTQSFLRHANYTDRDLTTDLSPRADFIVRKDLVNFEVFSTLENVSGWTVLRWCLRFGVFIVAVSSTPFSSFLLHSKHRAYFGSAKYNWSKYRSILLLCTFDIKVIRYWNDLNGLYYIYCVEIRLMKLMIDDY